MNAIGTQLRDTINSGLTPMPYGGLNKNAAAEIGRDPASRPQIQPEIGEMNRLDAGRDCRTRLARPDS